MKKIYYILLIPILTVFFAKSTIVSASVSPDAKRYKAAIVMEVNTGKILYQYNMNKILPQASLTKLMTYYTFMNLMEEKRVNLSKIIKIDVKSFNIPAGGSQIYLKKGDLLSIKQLLSALLIVSANDSALALERVYNSYGKKMITDMNQQCKALGFYNTRFVNTSGLTEEVGKSKKYNVTTAYELSKLSCLVLTRFPDILKITSKTSLQLNNRIYKSTNKLMKKYKGIDGLKTGRTIEAGYCFAATEDVTNSIGNGGKTRLLAIVLGCPTDASRFDEGRKLLDYAKKNFMNFKALSKESDIRIDKETYKNGFIKCRSKNDIYILKGNNDKITKTIIFTNKLNESISKGEKIGFIRVMAGKTTIEQDVVAANDYKLKSFPVRVIISIKNFFSNLF